MSRRTGPQARKRDAAADAGRAVRPGHRTHIDVSPHPGKPPAHHVVRHEPPLGRGERARFWLASQNSTRTGLLKVAVSLVFLLIGGLIALQMRTALATPQGDVISPHGYDAQFTAHGTFMAFFVAVPVFFAVASIILPRALRCEDMAFPRLNNFGFWLLAVGGAILLGGYLLGSRAEDGWSGYAPLSLPQYQAGHGMDWWLWGIFFETLGTLLAAVDVLVLIVRRRHPDTPMRRLPMFAWTMLFTSLFELVAAPALLTALSMLFLQRAFGAPFFTGGEASSLLLWQELFWFYSHPATYVMLLPAFGIVSTILGRFSGRPAYSYAFLLAGTAIVWVFSYLVFWHHMFTTGMNMAAVRFGSINTWVVSIGSGMVVFAWLASLWRGRLRMTVPMLWALGLIATFTIGGATGVFMSLVPVDYALHNTYWLVAHFHYVIVGSTIMGLIAGIYYWFPEVYGRTLDARLGRWHFWTTLVGIHLTFLPMLELGLMGMQRRVWAYPAAYGPLNAVATVGSYVFGASTLIFVWNLVATLRQPATETDASAWGHTMQSLAGPGPDDAEAGARRMEA